LEWSWKIIHALEAELFEAGFSSTLLPLRDGEMGLRDRLEQMGRSLTAVAAPGQLLDSAVLKTLDERDIPWVSINRPAGTDNRNYVSADNQDAGRQVGRLFARLGWERALVLGINQDRIGTDSEKVTGLFQGYIESCVSTAGIRIENCGAFDEMVGYRRMRQLLADGYCPQGIFATGDLLALGAIHALRDEGIEAPREVGVVGATGLSRGASFDPPLTVVQQPMEEIGRTAGQMLLRMIREGTTKVAPRRIPCELILRNSVAISDEVRKELERESR
jgi:LacI family transcriptional regulator